MDSCKLGSDKMTLLSPLALPLSLPVLPHDALRSTFGVRSRRGSNGTEPGLLDQGGRKSWSFPNQPLMGRVLNRCGDQGGNGNRGFAVKGHEVKQQKGKCCSRGHWRPGEDSKLKQLVALFGPHNWNFIAEKLEGRSGKSCRLRWFNQLHPRITREPFTEEEEKKLLAAHRAYGNKWAMIAKLFPGRTDNAVKNHWHVINARKQRRELSFAVHRKRKSPPPLPSPPHLAASRNEITVSNTTVDHSSASACTDLSLSLSLNKDLNVGQEVMMLGKERTVIHESSTSGGSSSSSPSSSSSSVADHHGDSECEKWKLNLPVYDFLGVGFAPPGA